MEDGTREAGETERERFRRVLLRVLAMQAVALLLLWALQSRYHGA